MKYARPLIRKLETAERLTSSEVHRVLDLCRSIQTVARRTNIVSEGERPDHVHIVLDGWAARATVRKNGTRQFTAFLLPGDFCDIHATSLSMMDHDIFAITDCQIAYADKRDIDAVIMSTPVLKRALWRSTLLDEAILRRWIVNNSSGDARTTIAHLFCELHLRMRAVGLVHGDAEFALPLTQEELADATGMTTVHANRTLKKLTAEGLVQVGGGRIAIPDVNALRRTCGFNPNYLHMLCENSGVSPSPQGSRRAAPAPICNLASPSSRL